jgi:RimJ/RimL family protein N-acetyltransferase
MGDNMNINKLTIINNRNNYFSFWIYNQNNIAHNKFVRSMLDDENIKQFVSGIFNDAMSMDGNIKKYGENQKTIGLLIKNNNDNKYIGMITIHENHSYISLDIAIHKRYRTNKKNKYNGKNNYGSKIIEMVSDDIFKKINNCNNIILEIKKDNIASVNMAKKAGFEIDYFVFEEFLTEGYDFTPFSKSNPYYNDIKTKSL